MRGTGNKYGTKRDKAEFLSKTQRVPRYPSTPKVGDYLPTDLNKPSYIGKRSKS